MWLGGRSFHIFALISTINGHSVPRNPYDFISELMEPASPNPLIVFINPTDQIDNSYDEQEQQLSPSQSLEENYDHKLAKLESANSLYNALINSFRAPLRDGDEDSPEFQDEKALMITNALRARCEVIIQCEEKCSEKKKKYNSCDGSGFCDDDSEPNTPKPYCPKSCKAVFDHLIKCPPPENRKKKKEQKKTYKKKYGHGKGKTMPPSWKKGIYADESCC